MIPINLPKIGEEEVQAVLKVLRSGMLTSGLGAGPQERSLKGVLQISLALNMPSPLTLAQRLCTQLS